MVNFENPEIHLTDLPVLSEEKFLPLESAYLTVSVISRLLSLLFVFTAFYIGMHTFRVMPEEYFKLLPFGIIGFSVLSLSLVAIGVRFKGYKIRAKDIHYKRGWISRSLTSVPFNRIQHVEIAQGMVDRWMGLATLKVYTAGGSQSDLSIPGLTYAKASKLRQFLLQKIGSDEEE